MITRAYPLSLSLICAALPCHKNSRVSCNKKQQKSKRQKEKVINK